MPVYSLTSIIEKELTVLHDMVEWFQGAMWFYSPWLVGVSFE